MSEGRDVNIDDRLDTGRLSRYQAGVVFLCALVALLDGFDTQAIAFVAPVIADSWGVDSARFGPIFAAGLLGLTLGALGFGLLADKIGRKSVIIISTLIFGSFACLTITATSLETLFIYRLLTGLGLGGAMPNIIALTAEYAPRRLRGTLVTLMFCGFPLGAVLGGPVSTALITVFGWESVFLLGGILPLALVPLLLWRLPESIRFLVQQAGDQVRVTRILNHIDPDADYTRADRFLVAAEGEESGLPLRSLFTAGRAVGTLLLWAAFFMNLLILYFLINWLPTVLRQAGFPLEYAIFGTVLLNAGGIAGGLSLGRFIDRLGSYRVMAFAYLAAAFFVAGIGLSGGSLAATLLLTFLAGFFVIGAQFGANALAAEFYPTRARSTGVGWALGIGRIGSIVGPLTGGVLLSLAWSVDEIFLISAIPALVASIAITLMARTAPSGRAGAAAIRPAGPCAPCAAHTPKTS